MLGPQLPSPAFACTWVLGIRPQVLLLVQTSFTIESFPHLPDLKQRYFNHFQHHPSGVPALMRSQSTATIPPEVIFTSCGHAARRGHLGLCETAARVTFTLWPPAKTPGHTISNFDQCLKFKLHFPSRIPLRILDCPFSAVPRRRTAQGTLGVEICHHGLISELSFQDFN